MVRHSTRYFAGMVYFLISLALLFLKFLAFHITSSQAIFSDAMESIVNVVASGLTFYVLYQNQKPHPKFPYGAGKLEYISSSTEGSLMVFASLAIYFQVFNALFSNKQLHELGVGLLLIGFTGLANLGLGLFLKHEAKKTQSKALAVSGSHVLTDVLTTAGVLVGLGLVHVTGWKFLDSLLALILATYIGIIGVTHVLSSLSEMIDKENPDILAKLEPIFNKVRPDGIIQIHQVKVIRSGSFHHIDAHFVVPEYWEAHKIHEELNDFEKKIESHYDHNIELGVHIDPCRRAYCKFCSISNCSVRQEDFVKKIPASVGQMRSLHEPEKFKP